MEMNDVRIPLMSDEDDIESGGAAENRVNEFICELYDVVLSVNHRTREEGVYRTDFLFDMFHQTVNGEVYWWMSPNHPLAIMIEDNNYRPYIVPGSMFGTAYIFKDQVVQVCLGSLEDMCKQNGLRVIEEI